MAEFNAQAGPEIFAACQEGKSEAAEAIQRTFSLETPPEVTPAEPQTISSSDELINASGAGLLILLHINDQAAIIAIPESSKILPDWYREPDTTGVSKLTTLAQELSMVFLPETFMALDFASEHVPDLSEAITRGQLASECGHIPIEVRAGEVTAQFDLLWPLINPNDIFVKTEDPTPEPVAEPQALPSQEEPSTSFSESQFETLPPYIRSLLKIKVAVRATLASTKMSVDKITKLTPGSMIQFNKSCEELLELEIEQQKIATGEAVKIGEKFGIRITEIKLPHERFLPIQQFQKYTA
ncbi:MAG: FliM/FliN family flagellar motor switch protein [Pirellulaceae bacterium]|nr:FliM/FliN family flagellar motor switch protein [Pirellulaceae bacterium]